MRLAFLFLISLFISLQNQAQELLFSTDSYTIKKLSRPEVTHFDFPIKWFVDHYSVTTLLVMTSENHDENAVIELYSSEKGRDGKNYLIGKELTDRGMIYEIVVDRKNQYLEFKSLKPIAGIYIKYFKR